jgi:hypothetical protein
LQNLVAYPLKAPFCGSVFVWEKTLDKENFANALIDQAKKLRRAFGPKSNIRLKWQAPVWIHQGAL